MKKLITTLIFIFSFTTSPYLFANNMLTPEQIKNLTSLAIKGDSNAQFNLGIIYYNGQGVKQDYQEAFKWFKLAVEQNHAGAQFNLGVTYYNGHGVKQDDQEAFKWFKLAAEQNYARAQLMLGIMYTNGYGVRQNYVTAKNWFGDACDNGLQEGCDEYKKPSLKGY